MLPPMGMVERADSAPGGLFSRDLAPEPRKPWLIRAAVVGFVALGCLGVWLWVHNSEGGALRALSPAQREALFKESWKDYRMKCPTHAERVDTPERCRQRAEFLMLFPQCDQACQTALAPALTGAPK
jgi:cytochrome b pre-mRNA-processing protein 3